jgi:hypothetical protein
MKLKTFTPCFDVLPQPQKALWSELKDVPDTFVLYGGTAIALQLGHRQSIDFVSFVINRLILMTYSHPSLFLNMRK